MISMFFVRTKALVHGRPNPRGDVDLTAGDCRYEAEANKADELAATSQRLSSELTAAQLEAQAAQEAAAAANAAAAAAATSAATEARELASRPSSRRSSFSEQNYARVGLPCCST